MDDSRIIDLYFARDERAISETRLSYGRLINSVAMGILHSPSESEECEDDTYLRAWQSMPPTRPNYLSAFLTRITRNLAVDRLRERQRRIPLGAMMVLDELSEAIPDVGGDLCEDIALRDAINGFIESLSKTKRQMFIKRYFYMREIKEISREMGIASGSVKVTLWRIRQELRQYLESRGIVI